MYCKCKILLFLVICQVILHVDCWNSNGEQCQTTSTGDSCDPSKYLNCKNTRCECLDTSQQIYSSIKVDIGSSSDSGRKKRSPKLGKVAAGGAGLAGGALIGYELSKVGQNSQNGQSDSGSSGNSHSSKHRNVMEVFSCYSRISSPCVLNPDHFNVLYAVPTTTTTTPVLNNTNTTTTNTTTDMINGTNVTTTASTTTHAPFIKPIDLLKLPKCVAFATCKPNLGKFGDSRVGECMCNEGYKKTTMDTCEKDKSAKNSADNILTRTYTHYQQILLFTIIGVNLFN